MNSAAEHASAGAARDLLSAVEGRPSQSQIVSLRVLRSLGL